MWLVCNKCPADKSIAYKTTEQGITSVIPCSVSIIIRNSPQYIIYMCSHVLGSFSGSSNKV